MFGVQILLFLVHSCAFSVQRPEQTEKHFANLFRELFCCLDEAWVAWSSIRAKASWSEVHSLSLAQFRGTA
jgi:hypothetical protein